MEKWTYKKAGVDIESGYEAVKLIMPHAARTLIPGVLEGIGRFGALFEVPQGYTQPVLVSGTDSVGSKIKIAFEMDIHNTIGIDCVAMCVNDIICMGAKPLYFLDYIGIGKLDPHRVEQIAQGVCDGCVQSGCALIGGETCEMPDIYAPGEYDLVGFAVGVVEKSRIIDGSKMKEGDVLLGVPSSGMHSNGFALARKLAEHKGIKYGDYINRLGKTLGAELLIPTKIYAKLINTLTMSTPVKGLANITGGAWYEKMPRMLPGSGSSSNSSSSGTGSQRLKLRLFKDKAPVPEIFRLMQEWGNIDDREMYSTFNMGVGMLICVDEKDADAAAFEIEKAGEQAYRIGVVEKRRDGEEDIIIE